MKPMNKVRIGIVGCGNISSAYLKYAKLFDFLEVAACADLIAQAGPGPGHHLWRA